MAEYIARSDTFTAAGNGVVSDSIIPRYFAIQVKGTGAAASAWSVVLEGSIDGNTYSTITTHNTAIGDGETLWMPTPTPCVRFRARCVSLTLGGATNIVVNVLGMN